MIQIITIFEHSNIIYIINHSQLDTRDVKIAKGILFVRIRKLITVKIRAVGR